MKSSRWRAAFAALLVGSLRRVDFRIAGLCRRALIRWLTQPCRTRGGCCSGLGRTYDYDHVIYSGRGSFQSIVTTRTTSTVSAGLGTPQDVDWYLMLPEGTRQAVKAGVLATLGTACPSPTGQVQMNLFDTDENVIPVDRSCWDANRQALLSIVDSSARPGVAVSSQG